MRHLASIAAAVLTAALALPALAEPIFPSLGPGQFKDCGALGALPDVCRERRDLSVAEADRRLGTGKIALWTDGDVFTVAARRSATTGCSTATTASSSMR